MGFIITDRNIVYWRWYTVPGMLHLFMHLILMANFKEGMWQGIIVKRGQLITSRNRLSRETGLTEKEVRTGLKRLQRTGEIVIKATNQYSMITICNYDTYQGQDNRGSQSKANERPTKVQREATIEKGKKERTENHSSSADNRARENDPGMWSDEDLKTYGGVDEEIAELRNSPIWKEKVFMRFKFLGCNEALLDEYLERFASEVKVGGKGHQHLGDVKKHFTNWMIIQEDKFNKNRNGNGTNNNNGYRSREDIVKGAIRIISRMRSEGRQPQTELPVV